MQGRGRGAWVSTSENRLLPTVGLSTVSVYKVDHIWYMGTVLVLPLTAGNKLEMYFCGNRLGL